MHNTILRQFLYSFIVLFFITLFSNVYAAQPLDTVYDTLSNPRISYRAGVGSSGASSGSTTITIDSSGNPDNDTHNLFPQDSICFSDSGTNGCIGNTSYTVGSVLNSTTFSITSALNSALGSTDLVIATESAIHTINLTTVADVNGGSLEIKIPAASSDYNDGIPDDTGFDANLLTNSNIDSYTSVTCSGGCGVTFGTTTMSTGSGYHTITFPFTGTLASSKDVTITIGTSTAGYSFINPAPGSSHTQGTSDVYSIVISELDSGSNTLYSTTTKVAVHEGVFVSATVEETLNFYINDSAGDGAADSGTICGVTRTSSSIDSTAYSIPFGTLAASDTFYDAYQTLKVITNASNGYVVTIEENDQMGRGGNTCTGSSPSSGEYTFGSGTCIRDTVCGSSACSESAAYDWTTATYYGLGISLEDVTGTDAVWDYDGKASETTCTSGTFCARQIADQESSETKATIMSNSGTTTGSKIDVCYRLSIPGDQPAGYYFNVVKYTATAKF